MKSVLSIILWVFAPMLTPYGLQIGEVKTNNQTIKIMKKFILSPEWLQGASNVSGGGGGSELISFITEKANPEVKVSCVGNVLITSTYQGVKTTQKLTDVSDQVVYIQSDSDAPITLKGKVTAFYSNINPYPPSTSAIKSISFDNSNSLEKLSLLYDYDVTEIDLSECKGLRDLEISCSLSALNVSDLVALEKMSCRSNGITSLNVSACQSLRELDCSSNLIAEFSASSSLENLNCGSNKIQNLDLSMCSSLENLNCSSAGGFDGGSGLELLNIMGCESLSEIQTSVNESLISIYTNATNQAVASKIASAITSASSADGTVTLRQGDEFNQTIIDAAMQKGWDVQYAS